VLALPCSPTGRREIPSSPEIVSPQRRSSQPELRPIREILKELL
jgi:hypothetical protein